MSSENKCLKEDLKRIMKTLEEMKTSNKSLFNNPFPVLQPSTSSILTNPVSNSNSSLSNINANPSRPLFSQIITTENPPSTPTVTTNQGSKRQRITQYNKDNIAPKPTSKIKPQLKCFDSYKPDILNKEIVLTKDEGYRLAGKKTKNNNTTRKSTNSQNYAQIIGRDDSNILTGKPKKFVIYLGKLDENTTEDDVENFLNSKLKSIKFDDNNIRDVKYYDLKELKPENITKNYKSYPFSVNFLDKEIMNMKSIWLLNC